MKKIIVFVVRLSLAAVILPVSSFAADPGYGLPQKVLYIGHRADEYVPFLKEHFALVDSVTREAFHSPQEKNFNVVLLDWPQSGSMQGAWLKGSPLGKREDWAKPTVLLASAGLNLAVAWKLYGGSGCTCLAPVACGLQPHEIFKSPIPIDISATISIPTPQQFQKDLKTPTMPTLPLIDGIHQFETVIRGNPRGWSSHYFEYADMPEVELFSGGINEQTARSAAFWRQGNLLHFGFEETPKSLNTVGKAMLVNAIVYISRFTEDRPIGITPSVFGEEKTALSRQRLVNYFTNTNDPLNWVTNELSVATLATFNWQDRTEATAWVKTNRMWIHPGSSNFLEVDIDAKSLGVPFDSPEFLPKTIAALGQEKTKARAATLLARYVNDAGAVGDDAAAWAKWWDENGPYVFYSELGCYRWYIDPLAKKRGVPTKDLRGPARADKAN
jgi:hypothetical protein